MSATHALPSRFGSPWSLVVVLMLVLFFQGCESPGVALTLGPVAPCLAVIYDHDDPWQTQWVYVSLPRIALNVVVLVAVLAIVPRFVSRWDAVVRSRRFQASATLVAILFNLVLFTERIWINLVYTPIAAICDWIGALVEVPQPWQPTTIAAVARGYFLACWLATYATLCVALWVAERYLGFDRRRWWQFNLRTLLTVTFVAGTGLGLIVRLVKGEW